MELHEFLKLLRTRWLTVVITGLATILAAIAYTLSQTPLYEASTRLFVSTVSGDSMSDRYSGNRLSQERVLSYSQLIRGETLAQRTINRLNLDIDAETMTTEMVSAKAQPNTVLINVAIRDSSPVRARDIANALSDEFVAMVRELETPSPGAAPDARVVVEQRATIPAQPVVPKPKRNIAFGLIIGLLLGVALAVLREVLDNTVKDRDSLERISGSGVVGAIPVDKRLRKSPAIAFQAENSPASEAFRKIRTNLQFLSVDKPPRLIAVTSSLPNEGKTTTAINIAGALCETGSSVLLIDGDMRRPSLDRYLEVVGSVGFSSVLSGATSLDEALQQTRSPNLKILAAGHVPPNPSELLASAAARNMLQEVRVKFDYVIVDTPPLLAVTDGAILASEVDGVLLMVRAGSTRRDQLTHSLGILEDVGASLLGTVLSMVPIRGADSYSYKYSYKARTVGTSEAEGDQEPTVESLSSNHSQPDVSAPEHRTHSEAASGDSQRGATG